MQADSILAGFQDRVIESAQWFAQGYFGRSWAATLNATEFSTIAENSSTPSWITPMNTCKNWQYAYGNNVRAITIYKYTRSHADRCFGNSQATIEWGTIYLPPIAKRLNKLLPGVNLTNDNVHGALYACAYDLAAHGVSPWCDAFTKSEIEDFEYELDLLMDGAFGYNLPTPMGPVLGGLLVKQVVDRFTNSTGDAKAVYLEFGHDTTIDLALTALGLAKDSPALSAKGPVPHNRKFRTTRQVPFAAQMVWEKFSCTKSFQGPQVRLVLNEAPLPLVGCKKVDKHYGSCSLDDFVAANADSAQHSWGDARWNATCGN